MNDSGNVDDGCGVREANKYFQMLNQKVFSALRGLYISILSFEGDRPLSQYFFFQRTVL